VAVEPDSATSRPMLYKFFSRNEYLTRFDRATNETHLFAQYLLLKYNGLRFGGAFVAGSELIRSHEGIDLYGSNHYGGFAFRFEKSSIMVELESRRAKRTDHGDGRRKFEPENRARVNRNQKSQRPLRGDLLSVIAESYVDIEWKPKHENNTVLNIYDIIGLRYQTSEWVSFETYLSPFILLDSRKTYENNRLEMRGNIGATITWGTITLSGVTSLLHTLDLESGDYQGNENKVSQWSGRYGLILNGEI